MRRTPLLLLAVLEGVLLVTASSIPVQAGSMGSWAAGASYPLAVAGSSCVTYLHSIYCVGGYDSSFNTYGDSYYASLSSPGVSSWSITTVYPSEIDSASCVADSGYVYCVGGENSISPVNSTFYSQLSSSGMGQWSATKAYPSAVVGSICVAYSSTIYCVGGSDGNVNTNATYFAQLSSSGIGAWSRSTSYPVPVDSASCVVDSGYIYCVGGEDGTKSPLQQVYYSHLSGSGIDKWMPTIAYPFALAASSCVGYAASIYCVGGFDKTLLSQNYVYSAGVSSSGIGAWTSASAYPIPIDTTSCLVDSGYVYCVAGVSIMQANQNNVNSVYFASLGPPSTTTATSSPSATTSTSRSSATFKTTSPTATATVTVTSVVTSTTTVSSLATATSSSFSSTSTTPEFPYAILLPATLLASLLVATVLQSRLRRRA